MKSKYPFKNLVFEGGGTKGLAYLGALEVLDQYDIIHHIDRVAGTSAGSIMATVVSLRLSIQDTIDTFNSIEFSKVGLDEKHEDFARLPNRMKKDLGTPLSRVEEIHRFNDRFGLFTLTYLHEWLQAVIARHCNGKKLATFADFKTYGFRDLYVVATNLSQHKSQVFSVETTPNAPVADAVRMSMSIPFYFEALQFDGTQFGQGDWFVDGGIFNNYPLDTFDQSRYLTDKSLFLEGVNWETLGCHLFTADECKGHQVPITNVPSFARNMFSSMLSVQKIRYQRLRLFKLRSININDCCVTATDSSATPGTKKYKALIASGKAAAQAYLTAYKRPDID